MEILIHYRYDVTFHVLNKLAC